MSDNNASNMIGKTIYADDARIYDSPNSLLGYGSIIKMTRIIR